MRGSKDAFGEAEVDNSSVKYVMVGDVGEWQIAEDSEIYTPVLSLCSDGKLDTDWLPLNALGFQILVILYITFI